MALSCFCKKCAKEVLPGASCPYCGGKLGTPHTLWRVQRRPVSDWISWNAPLRVVIPVLALVAAALVCAEAAMEGLEGVRTLLRGATPRVLLLILGAAVLLVFAGLLLRGRETLEMTADKSGVTLRVLLPKPGALCLLAHLRSPKLAARADLQREYGLLLSEQSLRWKEIRRVQWWQERSLLLLYAPAPWLRMALPCTAECWPELTSLIREHLGRRKDLRLPDCFLEQ